MYRIWTSIRLDKTKLKYIIQFFFVEFVSGHMMTSKLLLWYRSNMLCFSIINEWWKMYILQIILTLIGKVPFYPNLCILGYDSDGFVEIFSETRFKHDFLNYAKSRVRFCGNFFHMNFWTLLNFWWFIWETEAVLLGQSWYSDDFLHKNIFWLQWVIYYDLKCKNLQTVIFKSFFLLEKISTKPSDSYPGNRIFGKFMEKNSTKPESYPVFVEKISTICQ